MLKFHCLKEQINHSSWSRLISFLCQHTVCFQGVPLGIPMQPFLLMFLFSILFFFNIEKWVNHSGTLCKTIFNIIKSTYITRSIWCVCTDTHLVFVRIFLQLNYIESFVIFISVWKNNLVWLSDLYASFVLLHKVMDSL